MKVDPIIHFEFFRSMGRCVNPDCHFTYERKPGICPECATHLGGSHTPQSKKRKLSQDTSGNKVTKV